MDILDKISGNRSSGWKTQPWRTRLPGGVYLTRGREAWLYRVMPLTSLEWEDPPKRLQDQQRFERLLVELGDTARDLGQGTRSLSQNRGMHIVSLLVDIPTPPDPTVSPELNKLHEQMLPNTVVRKFVFVGVKLRRDAVSALMGSESDEGWSTRAKRAFKSLRDNDVSAFAEDKDKVSSIMNRAGAREPTDEEMAWLESWFSGGEGTDVALAASDLRIRVPDGTGWQISAFMGIESEDMWLPSPYATWALDAMNHPAGADAISMRCELEPANVTRARLRRSQRIIASQEEEEEATGDVARDELGERRGKAKEVENYTRAAGHAWLTNSSVLFARRLGREGEGEPDETFADAVNATCGMNIKPLEKRQLQALAEMLPGDGVKVNPFVQDVNPAWVAYSGMTGFGDVGDETGLLLGESAPHYTTVRIDYLAAAKKNKGPAMCIFGRPGSGKASWVEAKILTPTGWVRMGDVVAGAEIIGSDGATQTVVGVYPQGKKELYRVTFSDGSKTTVTADHWWTVHSDVDSRTLLTTAELEQSLREGGRWDIPTVLPVHFNFGEPDLDAGEVVEQWLENGEGFLSEQYHTAPLQWRESFAKHVQHHLSQKSESYRPSDFTAHVGYLLETPSSHSVRLPSLTHAHTYASLLWSLGQSALLDRLTVTVYEKLQVRTVVSVDPVGIGQAQCIKVSNSDSLYVTDDYICTHNTFAAQFLAGQAALNGTAAILINPKGHDSLSPFAHWITRMGGQAQIVSLSKLESEGGAFDPFRFCADPRMAAEVLDRHIIAVLGSSVGGGMTGRQETELSRGLAEGADKGARCASEALAYVRDEDIREMVLAMAESNSLFRLGFGMVPQQGWGAASGFTLIEFDREMSWPTAGKNPAEYDRPERLAVSALRLISRASLEILMASNGGILVVDEAHHFLASAEGRATVDRINREGRSLKLLPIFCTQRVTDLVNESAVDMETFISRVLVLTLPDKAESSAALRLCGLEADEARTSYLRTSPSGWGFFRDVDDRHSVVHVGAGIGPQMHQSMSTNYTDREARGENG